MYKYLHMYMYTCIYIYIHICIIVSYACISFPPDRRRLLGCRLLMAVAEALHQGLPMNNNNNNNNTNTNKNNMKT